jgi:tetratricopeptide (TPR) repeat protein
MKQLQIFGRYLALLLAVLLACGSLFGQKSTRRTPAPQNKDSEALIEAGDKFVDERKWNEAADAYLKATRVDPQNSDAHVGLGNAYMGAGKWAEALVVYKKAVALDPRNADAQYALGDAYNSMRMHGDAFAPLVKATQLDPTFAEAFCGIGDAYLSGEQYAKSVSYFNSAIRLKPDYEDAHYGLAIAYLNLGNQKGLNEQRRRLVSLNSARVTMLDSVIGKFNPAASAALRESEAAQSVADAARAQEPEPEPVKRKPQAPPLSAKQKAAVPNDPTSLERALWESIKDSKDPEDFNYYLRKFPNGEFAKVARSRAGQSKPASPAATIPAPPSVAEVETKPRVAPSQNAPTQVPEPASVTKHAAPVLSIAFSPDGSTLATGDSEGAIKLWNAQTGAGLRTLADQPAPTLENPGVQSLTFSADGKILAAARVLRPDAETDPDAVSKSEIAVWDVASGKLLKTLGEVDIEIKAIALSPDSRLLASGGSSSVVTLWDIATGAESRTFSGRSGVVDYVLFTPDGTQVASGSWNEAIDLWQVTGITRSKQIDIIPEITSTPKVAAIFSPFAKRAVSVPVGDSETIVVRESPSMKTLREFKWKQSVVSSIALSSSGKTLAAGNLDGEVRLWDIDSGKELLIFKKEFSTDVPASNAPAGDVGNPGEAAFWKLIENSSDPKDFEEYLKAYPNGVYAPLARLKMRKLTPPK